MESALLLWPLALTRDFTKIVMIRSSSDMFSLVVCHTQHTSCLDVL
jgi:hypothetical protein